MTVAFPVDCFAFCLGELGRFGVRFASINWESTPISFFSTLSHNPFLSLLHSVYPQAYIKRVCCLSSWLWGSFGGKFGGSGSDFVSPHHDVTATWTVTTASNPPSLSSSPSWIPQVLLISSGHISSWLLCVFADKSVVFGPFSVIFTSDWHWVVDLKLFLADIFFLFCC